MRERNRKVLLGTVASHKMDKTVTVKIERRYKHAKYGKYVLATERYAVHDEKNEARAGDRVEICETRPLSKKKRWRLTKILHRAPSREGASS